MNIFSSIILLQIFIFALCLLLTIGYLSLRNLVLPCFGCSKGSWWYTCAANTGYGSAACELYKKTYGIYSKIINSYYLLINYFEKLEEKIADLKQQIADIANKGNELIQELTDTVTNAIQLPDMPTINEPICEIVGEDPCKPIRVLINNTIAVFWAAGGGLIQGLQVSINVVFNEMANILTLIIKGIIKLVKLITDNITKPIEELITLITSLTKDIDEFIESIQDLGIVNIIIFNIISFLNIIIPGPLIRLISYAGIILFLCIVLPLIAFMYIIFSIIFYIAIFPLKLAWWIISNIFIKIFSVFT